MVEVVTLLLTLLVVIGAGNLAVMFTKKPVAPKVEKTEEYIMRSARNMVHHRSGVAEPSETWFI